MKFTPVRLLLLVVVVGVCAAGFLTQVSTRFTLYRSPFAQPLPWGPGGVPLTQRVVLCLVDGLRLDASRRLETLNALRERGADWELTVSEPTNSIPLSHVIVTGAPQTTIGLLHNRTPIGPGFYRTFGNLYTAAQHAGLRTGNVVTWRPGYPLAEILDAPNTLPGAPGDADDDGLVPRVREVLSQPDAPHFLWVHFDIVDRAGHEAGGASAEYAAAAARTDERIGHIASALDLTRETLVVTADHGHLNAGGHGGGEPEVATVPCIMVGAGIAPGTAGQGAQVDLAPTIAWLLGTPLPTHAEGWPLVDAVVLDGEVRARRSRDTVAQLLRAYEFRLEQFGIHDEKVDAPMPHGLRTDTIDVLLQQREWDFAYAEAANLRTEVRTRWMAWQAHLERAWFRPRMFAAIGLGLFAFVASVVGRRRRVAAGAAPVAHPPLWLLVGIGTGMVVPVVLYLAQGHHYSLSSVWWGGRGPFMLWRMAEGAVGVLVAWGVARIVGRSATVVPPAGTMFASLAGALAGLALGGMIVYLIGVGLHPQPWHTSFMPLAILIVGLLQFLGVAMLALPCAIVLAARDTPAETAEEGGVARVPAS